MTSSQSPTSAANPLLATWETPFGAPPFPAVTPDHILPAYEEALTEHAAEIEAIATDSATPTFENTVAAMERSGRLLDRVGKVFHALAGAHTNDALLGLERELSPRMAAHWNKINMDARLFARIEALVAQQDALGLSAEQRRVLDRYRIMFQRAGAGTSEAAKARLAQIGERLAELGTAFSQNVLADEQSWTMMLDERDLAGMSPSARASAADAATARGAPGHYAITLSRSSVEPFLQSSDRRDLREKAFRAWIARGDTGGKTDNKAIIAETVRLRAERAKLLGYDTFAAYRLDDAMAKTPRAVRDLLDQVWTPARARALADRDAMQAIAQAGGQNLKFAAWDWRYYAEKLRRERCDIDEAEIAPYLSLDRMIEAAFDCAHRLFGLTVSPRNDVPAWHPDVRVWEVKDKTGRHLGLFFGDYYARPSKRSGAWMTTLRDQENMDHEVRPLVVNVINFAKAADGQPTLLSFDDARTLFHEFGHGLHGLLSNVTYPTISGTGVSTDFVELPSQLYEHWLEQPEVLRRFALHHETGKPMPEDLLARLIAARTFNQGFATVEYVASALVDLDYHSLESADGIDAAAFEKTALERIGMPDEIVMRHRSPHFSHVFSGDHYASAYYSYMWSEVLDADAFDAFKEAGDVFDPKTAQRLHDYIYSAGGSREPDDAYTAFRGRLPTPDALLRKRGFMSAPLTTPAA